ncbi:MAG: prolyl oligopeptidase family serine peptidase [Verrucomicrobiales bacterium]|nr:prolyl oligopeptidase family serine peptidase [Verrucomicrobiales bacterium]
MTIEASDGKGGRHEAAGRLRLNRFARGVAPGRWGPGLVLTMLLGLVGAMPWTLRAATAAGAEITRRAAGGERSLSGLPEFPRNVRAWCTNGQVWVVFQPGLEAREGTNTFALWYAPAPFTNTSQARLVTRLFASEVLGLNLARQAKVAFGEGVLDHYTVPLPGGGRYALQPAEGLMVATVRQDFSGYFAVTSWGETDVAARNRTGLVTGHYSLDDPPRPQRQIRRASVAPDHAEGPTTNQVSIFITWVDGDQDLTQGRPDFPILANAARGGVPHLFLTCEPQGGLPGQGPWPATMCFHGANGDAEMWLPNGRASSVIGLLPRHGLLVAFDDELTHLELGVASPTNTRWVGYVPEYDPFSEAIGPGGVRRVPSDDAVIVNYTQRRVLYVLDWLVAQGYVDAERVALVGHSWGSMGAQMLARSHPDRFSLLHLYNCGMRFVNWIPDHPQIGTTEQNLPVTLTNHLGELVRFQELSVFSNRVAAARDWPLIRHFHGKCDHNGCDGFDCTSSGVMFWGPDMVEQMRASDREGTGVHFYWDLRGHGFPEWRGHWTNTRDEASVAEQTRRDDLGLQARHRVHQSYPAFFHLQRYAGHGDPGPGELGGRSPLACLSNLTNGDDSGTWGGAFDWDVEGITDTLTRWESTLWLVGAPELSGLAAVDEATASVLVADVAIRRPQQFKPSAGTRLAWQLTRVRDGSVVQSGETVAGAEGLVTVRGLRISKDPDRVRLSVTDPGFVVERIHPSEVEAAVHPDFDTPHLLVVATNVTSLGRLLVHLPGTGSSAFASEEWLRTAAVQGYHALGLKYQNDPSMASVCSVNPNLDCFEDLAEETVTGLRYADDRVDAPKQVRRVDSVEVRLQSLLTYLAVNAPAEHQWGQYLDELGNIRWDRVAVSGHSQGGSCALYLAQTREVSRAVLFATADWIHFPVHRQPDWFGNPSATPRDRIYGLTHRLDTLEEGIWQQAPIWDDLQISGFGPLAQIETSSPPYLGTRTFTSLLRPPDGSARFHNCIIVDAYLPRTEDGQVAWRPVWMHMLTNTVVAGSGLPDFGDAPASYGTALAQNGARHRVLPGLRLGARLDPESDGQASLLANGDDASELDDEDGVQLLQAPVRGATVPFTASVRAPGIGAFLDAFVDLNADGDFADAGEKVLDRAVVTNGLNTLSFLVPSTASVGRSYARLRLSSAGGLGPLGEAPDGEVEDYVLAILPEPLPNDGSGIEFVPYGGASLKTTATGGVEASGLNGGGRLGIQPGETLKSHPAGRVVMQLDPPIALLEGNRDTDLVMLGATARVQTDDGTASELEFRVVSESGKRGVALWFDEADAIFGRLRSAWGEAGIRVSAFDGDRRHAGDAVTDPGALGTLIGGGAITGLGWATAPGSLWLALDQPGTFRTSRGQELKGRWYRFVLPEVGDEVLVSFRGLDLHTGIHGGGTLGLKRLRALIPEPPKVIANSAGTAGGEGTQTLGTVQMEDQVFYRVDHRDELGASDWVRGAASWLGTGAAERLSGPRGGAQRFYRVVAE